MYADGLRLDIEGVSPQVELQPAQELGEHLLRMVRACTRQWWVLRGASDGLAPLQNAFAIDSFGQPTERSMYASVSIIPWLQTERLLDDALLRLSCRYVEAGADVPDSVSTLLDAVFSACHGDRRQAILLAAIACEMLFAEQTEAAVHAGHATAKNARSARQIRDFRVRVAAGGRLAFGRSFAEDAPDAHRRLSKLWVARHALAHGSPAQMRRAPELAEASAFAEAMRGAYDLFEWSALLWPRVFPDVMELYGSPLVRVT